MGWQTITNWKCAREHDIIIDVKRKNETIGKRQYVYRELLNTQTKAS